MTKRAEIIQESYYKQTAENYDKTHVSSEMDGEHDFNLYFLSSIIKIYNIQSILDVGAGTGRVISFINKEHPHINIVGIEPVKELREQGYIKGISTKILVEGDGNKIAYNDNQFDLVCEFGMLHHVANPNKVISEMIRVSNKGIFISDSNNFGQGNYFARTIKQTLNFLGLWRFYNFIKTKGKYYQISEGDGLFYSYSVFNNLKQIKKESKEVFFLSSKNSGKNLYKTSSHIGLLAIKK